MRRAALACSVSAFKLFQICNALTGCQQGINIFNAPAANLFLHPAGHLPRFAAVFRLLAQQGKHFAFRAAFHLFPRAHNDGYLAEQVIDLIDRGVTDLHFYTMNKADLVYAICHLVGLKPDKPAAQAVAAE